MCSALETPAAPGGPVGDPGFVGKGLPVPERPRALFVAHLADSPSANGAARRKWSPEGPMRV